MATCSLCDKPRANDTTDKCIEHWEISKTYSRKWHQKFLDQGICVGDGCWETIAEGDNHTRCEDCREVLRNTEYLRGTRNKELPAAKLSLLEAMVLKHEYMVKKLQKCIIPDRSAKYSYVDSEFRNGSQDHNKASNVDEWSVLDFTSETDATVLVLKAKAFLPTPAELMTWAESLKSQLNGKIMVLYGTSKRDLHRLKDLVGSSQPGFLKGWYEPQAALFSLEAGLVSTDPADETRPDRPLYVPHRGLSSIFAQMNTRFSTGEAYRLHWCDNALFDGLLNKNRKSSYNAIKLAEVLRVFREKREGILFSERYPPPIPSIVPISVLSPKRVKVKSRDNAVSTRGQTLLDSFVNASTSAKATTTSAKAITETPQKLTAKPSKLKGQSKMTFFFKATTKKRKHDDDDSGDESD